MHTIKLFMWGYQPHFQISAKTAAEGVFSKLDTGLIPNVFLIGVLVEDRVNRDSDRLKILLKRDSAKNRRAD